jgi:hypothetical protein
LTGLQKIKRKKMESKKNVSNYQPRRKIIWGRLLTGWKDSAL